MHSGNVGVVDDNYMSRGMPNKPSNARQWKLLRFILVLVPHFDQAILTDVVLPILVFHGKELALSSVTHFAANVFRHSLPPLMNKTIQ